MIVRDTIISLCDVTGNLVEPWLRLGYKAILVDPQHPEGVTVEGDLTRIGHVVDHPTTWRVLRAHLARTVFVAGFPVCTQLAISGTRHWESKRAEDVHFQARAMQLVHECRVIGEMAGVPYFFENPVSAISSIYRKPDFTFDPADYGGYLPEGDEHPEYPDYFPPRDAYGKKTCLWTGGGFTMPPKRQVPIADEQLNGAGGRSKSYSQLGGKSDRTKNIRSATPRGFAIAVSEWHGNI